jgi:hypothetical protein
MPRAPLFRGNYLRMALLQFRLAYIIVAVLRSTALRRVVDGSLDHRRHRHGETSSSLHPGVNTVRPHPPGSGRSVLTPGPHRLLKSDRAPHLWCVASKRQSEGTFGHSPCGDFHLQDVPCSGFVPEQSKGGRPGPHCRIVTVRQVGYSSPSFFRLAEVQLQTLQLVDELIPDSWVAAPVHPRLGHGIKSRNKGRKCCSGRS